MSGRWRAIRSGLPRLLWFTNQMMLISIWNHEHVYVYQFGLGRFNSSYIQGSCLGCVTDTLDLTEPFLFQGGTLVGVCVIVELMSYHELSVHWALFVNVMAKHCLSYNQQFTLILCSSSLSTRGLADFLLLTLTFVGWAVAVASGDDFTNRYIWQMDKLFIGNSCVSVLLACDMNTNKSGRSCWPSLDGSG